MLLLLGFALCSFTIGVLKADESTPDVCSARLLPFRFRLFFSFLDEVGVAGAVAACAVAPGVVGVEAGAPPPCVDGTPSC